MSNFEVQIVPLLQDNYGYLLHESDTRTTGVVDPGEAGPILHTLRERGLSLNWILITHHHGDHVGGVDELKRETGAQSVGPRADNARIAGLDLTVAEGESFSFGHSTAEVYETPGHTKGHIAFYFPQPGILFAGDTLFVLGCGRLFEDTPAAMWTSLSKLAALPAATQVYCGHEYTLGNARFALTIEPDNAELQARVAEIEAKRARGEPTVPTTIGEELATNPFLRADAPTVRAHLGMADAPAAEVFAEIRRRKDAA